MHPMLTPTARMTFGYTSRRLLLWGEKEKMPAAPKGKGPLYPQESLAPALCQLLLLHAGRGMTREGKHKRARGLVIVTPCHHFLMFHEKQTAANLVNFI